MKNPFPGPQPYRAEDRERFFGRDDLSYKLQGAILAHRCVTVYGPSGAGKSSILQASVLPELMDRQDVRVLRVDAWPEDKAPTLWLADAMYAAIGLGDVPDDVDAKDAVFRAAKGSTRGSSRPWVVYLDQLEQLLVASRSFEETSAFFECLEALLDLPLRSMRVVLSLREDYLGRFRDRLRDMYRVTENGFRVGPLNVTELSDAVVATAAAGEPLQAWDLDEMRRLMLQVRVPGQAESDNAEAQSAYAQIVCRALFQERAAGKTAPVTEAETIVQRYLDTTLAMLGPLRQDAERLLEEHLVSVDGSRTLRTEKELVRLMGEEGLPAILRKLEGAAILRAEEHHGSRYFELGHDWLARRAFEQRGERERITEQKRIEETQRRQIEKSRVEQRKLRRIATAAIVTAGLVGASGVVAWIARSQAIVAQHNAEMARQKAVEAEGIATRERDEANDLRVMAGYLALAREGDLAGAMKLLAEVKKPDERAGWINDANVALRENALIVTLRGHRQALRGAWFSPNGSRVLTASADGTARVFAADGTGVTVVFKGHSAEITSASFSPDTNPAKLRVLTTSADGTARLWTLDGREPMVLGGNDATNGQTTCGVFDAEGARITTSTMFMNAGKTEVITRVFSAFDGAILGEHREHHGRVFVAAFLGERVVTVSEDKTALLWDGKTKGKISKLPGHTSSVFDVAVHRETRRVVTASEDGKARVFQVDERGEAKVFATLEGHASAILHVAMSHDGKRVATGSADRTARVWDISTEKPMPGIVLPKHTGSVTWVAFHPTDASIVATASTDHVGRVFRVDVPDEPLRLEGHRAPLRSIVWSPDGGRLLTASGDVDSADATARVWSAAGLSGVGQKVPTTFHAASFSEDGAVMGVAYDDATVEVRHREGRLEPSVIAAPKGEEWGWVTAVATNSDGSMVVLSSLGAVGGSQKETLSSPALHVFAKGEPWSRTKRLVVPAVIRSLAWNRTGSQVIAGLEDGSAMVVDIEGDKPTQVFRGHDGWLTGAVLSLDGQHLVTTSVDGTARIFDIAATNSTSVMLEHGAVVNAAAFDPRGEFVATASADGNVRVFPVRGGEPVVLDGKHGELQNVVFSRDGKRLAALSSTGVIIMWSPLVLPIVTPPKPFVLDAGKLVMALVVNDHEIWAATAAKTLHWELDIDRLLADLRTLSRDCLSAEDRVLYLNETVVEALRAYGACEECEGRVRPNDTPSISVATVGGLRARVLVLPGDAAIEVDGVPVSRRAGFLEMVGVVGEKKKLRLIRGEVSIEKEVLLDASGAKPAFVDMDAELAYRRGLLGPIKKADDKHFDPLMPDGF